jgi:hypothetical protein
VQRVELGRSLGVAALCALVPLAGNVAAAFLTDWTGVGTWLVVPVVAVCVAMLIDLIQIFGSGDSGRRQPDGYREWPEGRRPSRTVPERRGTSLPVALLMAILVLGVGGWGLVLGVRYAVGYVTGNESGSERLKQPARASDSGLTLTVQSVKHTAHFTRVDVAARNDTGISLTLPLFGNCRFVGGGGTTLEADPHKSRWPDGLAPGGSQRGTITFNGHLPDRAKRATLVFSTVYRQGFEGPTSIQVTDIRLKRP